MMAIFGMYKVPTPVGMGGYCDSQDFCPDYARPWDAVYTWLYWVSAGVIAEILICFLPSHDTSFEGKAMALSHTAHSDDGSTAPLLDGGTTFATGGTESGTHTVPTTDGSQDQEHSHGHEDARRLRGLVGPETTAAYAVDGSSQVFIVNVVGCFLAGVTVTVTSTLFYKVLTKNDEI